MDFVLSTVNKIVSIVQILSTYFIGNWEALVVTICAITIVIAIAKSFLKMAVLALVIAILCIVLSYLVNGNMDAFAGTIPVVVCNLK